MLRKLLTVVLPFLLPILLYFLYLGWARRRAQASGAEPPPPWYEGPWLWAVVAGAGLVAVALVAVRLHSGVPPGVAIESPRWEGDRVIPSRPTE
jgi:hypothetical protein